MFLVKFQNKILKQFDLEFEGLDETTKSTIDQYATFQVQTGLSCIDQSFVAEFEMSRKVRLLEEKLKTMKLDEDITEIKTQILEANKSIASLEK